MDKTLIAHLWPIMLVMVRIIGFVNWIPGLKDMHLSLILKICISLGLSIIFSMISRRFSSTFWPGAEFVLSVTPILA